MANLPHRSDRWEATEAILRRRGVRAERHEALDGRAALERHDFPTKLSPGEAGLLATFIEILEEARESSAEWLIFLEDDVYPFPLFAVRLRRTLARARRSTWAIQLGWISRVRTDPSASVWENVIVRLLRPRYRLRRLLAATRSREARSSMRSRWRDGTHALALRRESIDDLLRALSPFDVPLDELFIQRERHAPQHFGRSRWPLATQRLWPSDINPSHVAGHSPEE